MTIDCCRRAHRFLSQPLTSNLFTYTSLSIATALISFYAPLTAALTASSYGLYQLKQKYWTPPSPRVLLDQELIQAKENPGKYEIGPFPFYTTSIEDIQGALRLSSLEYQTLKNFILEKTETWEKLSEGEMISESAQLCTQSGKHINLYIFRQDKDLNIQVDSRSYINQGSYKLVTHSLEWRTKTLWAKYVANLQKPGGLEAFEHGLKIHNQIANVPGIHPPFLGGKPLNENQHMLPVYFSPLREGDMFSCTPEIWNETYCRRPCIEDLKKQKYSITYQLLQILDRIEENNFSHSDIQTGNILWLKDKNGKIYVELNDFDNSTFYTTQAGQGNLAEERENSKHISMKIHQDIRSLGNLLHRFLDSNETNTLLAKIVDQARTKSCSARQLLDQFEQAIQA